MEDVWAEHNDSSRRIVAIGGLLTVLSMTLETIINKAIHIRYVGDIILQNSSNVSVPINNHYEWFSPSYLETTLAIKLRRRL